LFLPFFEIHTILLFFTRRSPSPARIGRGAERASHEEDFLGFSYGFRPGRCQHDALDALWVGIDSTKVGWVLDADIQGFFDAVDHEWLIRFVEHRRR